MPRCHSSSIWFFLNAQRKTDMAIATDVDGDDCCALSLIPAPLEPLKIMSTEVIANMFFCIYLGIPLKG